MGSPEVLNDMIVDGERRKILLIEPFYAGSHKRLVDLLLSSFDLTLTTLITMPGKKWPWRARTSALWLSTSLPEDAAADVKTLFVSSVLNLAELVSLRSDILRIPNKILYFHENQLVYPVRNADNRERDFQFGYNQILSCLVADKVFFNSRYNMNSFLDNIDRFLNLIPDHRPKNLKDKIAPKCGVLYFPVDFTGLRRAKCLGNQAKVSKPLHILWPHRWEHDKDPDLFFETLFRLKDEDRPFRLSVLGERFSQTPPIFDEAETRLSGEIVRWGFAQSREDYAAILQEADVVVSTAKHEFFGVAMLEAIHAGCYPLAPKSLVYPELYPDAHLFSTPTQLFNKLKRFCEIPALARSAVVEIDTERFSWSVLRSEFRAVLG